MELSKQRFGYWLAPVQRRIRCDAAQEAVVPDSRGDLASVALVSAAAFIDDKSAADGALRLAGRVRADVICSDEDGGVFPIHLNMPFRCSLEGADVNGESVVRLRAYPLSLSARELNSRKISARAEVLVCAELFNPAQAELCGGVCEDAGLCVKRRGEMLPAVVSVTEKRFEVSERLDFPQGAIALSELLRGEVALSCTDCKAVGGKAIFKGTARVRAVYLDEDGAVASQSFELPFSQIIETRWDEACACSVELRLVSAELEPIGMQALQAELSICAAAICRGQLELECVEDAYSLEGELNASYDELCFAETGTPASEQTSVRELIGTGSPVRSVADVTVAVGPAERDENGLCADAEIALAYYDSSGTLASAKRTVKVCAGQSVPESAVISAALVGDVYAAPASGGVEVRFTVEFVTEPYFERCFRTLASAEQGAKYPAERPALVLKAAHSGDSLWELAKRYGSTTELIEQLNGMTGEVTSDGFVLIPAAGRGRRI